MSTNASLTPQQQAAIETRAVSVVLSAGAGCGKTFVLTQRFLSHLEPYREGHKLSGLVAITFTDRAAREMRERIREACRERLKTCPTEEIEHWLAVSREIDSARISTFHSFCSTLLRGMAVEAGIDPGFSLLEKTVAPIFLREAVQDSLYVQLADKDPSAVELVAQVGLPGAVEIGCAFVRQRFSFDGPIWREMTPEELAAHWEHLYLTRGLPLQWESFRGDRSTLALRGLLDRTNPPNDVMRQRAQALLDGLNRTHIPSTRREFGDFLSDLREHAQVKGAGTAKSWNAPELYEAYKSHLGDFRELLKKLSQNVEYADDYILKSATFSLHGLRCAMRCSERYQQRKDQASTLDFDDLLLRVTAVLRDDERVRSRVSRGIEFLLVDEFQDTDPIQAELVRHLCGDRLTLGKLFLVGDAQQSIYRFRRADPTVFQRLKQEIPPEGRLPLNRNFRSQPAILNFANALFEVAMGRDFQPLVPVAEQLSPAASIEFCWADDPGEDEDFTADARRIVEAQWLARRIHELLGDPTPRIRERDPLTKATHLRRVRPGDIVLLFRALTDVRHYEAALRELGIDYYLVGGRAFYAQQEVYDLTHVLRCLLDPHDEVSLLGLLRSPFVGLTDDTITILAREGGGLSHGLEHYAKLKFAEQQAPLVAHVANWLAELRVLKDRVSLSELLELILDRTGYDATLLGEFLGERKLANLNKLRESARIFDQQGGLGIQEFVERLRDSISEEADEEQAATQGEASDVVRLMTIHQSKGLEFPVVLVVDLERVSPASARGPLFHAELGPLLALPEKHGEKIEHLGRRLFSLLEEQAEEAEGLRVLYVAVTRAADHLILSSGVTDLDRPKSRWMKLLAERFDLRTGQARVTDETPADSWLRQTPEIKVHLVSPRSPVVLPEQDRPLPLKDLVDAITNTQEIPWPPLYGEVPAYAAPNPVMSVSQLEALAEEVPPKETQPAETDSDSTAVDAGDATRFGMLLHGALERLEPRGNAEQLPMVLARSAAVLEMELSPTLEQRLLKMLRTWWDSTLSGELREARQVLQELDFVGKMAWGSQPHQQLTITGQIDCLYLTATGEWIIVDYKSGSRLGRASDATLIETYRLQLELYAWAVWQWSGKLPREVRLVLWQPQWRVVSYQVTEDNLRQLPKRVEGILSSAKS